MNMVDIEWVHALVTVIFLCYSDPYLYCIEDKLFFLVLTGT